ncbi:MAG: hypothetical protein ACKOA1_11090 [Bacteroidota bacterium]
MSRGSIYIHLFFFLYHFMLVKNGLAQSFINPSIEQWAVPGVCETNLAPDFWVNFSNGGLGPDEGNYPLCPSTIPGSASNGSVYARYMAGNPRSGEGMAQTVAGFSPGKPFSITFDYAGSNLWGGSDSMRVHVFIDGVVIDSTDKFSSLDTVWSHHSSVFIPTASCHSIGFRIYAHRFPSSGGSGALDNFGLEEYVISVTNEYDNGPNWEVMPSLFKNATIHHPVGRTFYKKVIFEKGGHYFPIGSVIIFIGYADDVFL